MMLKRFVVVVSLVGVGQVANADALDTAIKKAVREYSTGSYKKAVATLRKIVERGGDAKKRALGYRLLGASFGSINKEADATAAFRKAIELDPDEGLDPNRYPPSLVDLFASVKAKMRGKLTIRCDRADAQVEIDGKPAGKCGEVQDVPSGPRKVVVTSKGKSQERTINVAVDGAVAEEIKFGPSTGRIAIDSVPKGATVTIGEKAIGKTPIENYEIDAGEYWVVLELPGFAPIREKVVIEAGGVKALLKPLEKSATTATVIAPVPPTTTTTTPTTATPPTTTSTPLSTKPTTTVTTSSTPPATTITKPVPPPVKTSRWKRTLGWTLAVVGAATLGVGVVFGVLNESEKSRGEEAQNQKDYNDAKEKVETLSGIATLSLVTGGVLAVTGAIFLVLDLTSKKSVADSPIRALSVAAVRDLRGAMTPMLSGAWRF